MPFRCYGCNARVGITGFFAQGLGPFLDHRCIVMNLDMLRISIIVPRLPLGSLDGT